MSLQPLIIIPSRLASTRLERKSLALIDGLPMVVQVLRRALEADMGPVSVACCGPEIAEVVHQNGGQAILTDPDLPSGTDRMWAAIQTLSPESRPSIVINLQGDLPNISASVLQAVLRPLENPAVDIATIACVIENPQDLSNENVVKIALAKESATRGRGLYFSRATIPFGADTHYHHIGVYAYRYKALEKFVSLPASPLEKAERLEQLRALEAGMRIDVELVETIPHTVDTALDLEAARNWFERQ
ncbi:3-deoxy-manno-octulosonate cytidylyltransferase [Candidatus Finniella inopinata]|uniref:3-deoxy-manno-octulosonate cytidylyltransferase n=1 Tax=Candidatus Finniella inopinata TaxID=1696036 RepID=A0A4Q7DJC6_9PROT|nr:3-deoxy-manno-octulosonate cytidylyltransferase [Candidatus Finniella inopinata]RZI46134.1 3-deoxy-manno-octulosonate cytidylyltransferase [Candidatus Finniella inopinata]